MVWLLADGPRKVWRGIEEELRARENDPLSTIVETDICQLLSSLGREDEAIRHAQRALELDPGFPLAHLYLAEAYAGKKNYPEAIIEARKALDLSADPAWAQSMLARMYALTGQIDKGQEILHAMLETANQREDLAICLARVYAALGKREAAFAWLERAYRNHEGGLILLHVDPEFQTIRQDPRFTGLVGRIGLRYPSS